MNKKYLILGLVFSITTIAAMSQSTVPALISAVEQNNRSLRSNKKYWAAKQAEYKTGLTPYDPQVEYDYLFGSPVGAGNQKDFSITQRMDFPTVYRKKRALFAQQTMQAGLQQQVYRQDVLLEAKLLGMQVIYLNKKDAALNQRLTSTQQLVQDYQKKLDKGDVIILDVNKAKLQLLNIKNETALNENERTVVLTKLTELNGGIAVAIADTTYPDLPAIPGFDILDSTIEANDPLIKLYEQEKQILEQQVAMQRALNLPKFEAGYHSQGILGQSYRGFHAGITIPLWENKNKLAATKANVAYAEANTETHRLEHRLENKQYYDLLDTRLQLLQEYKALLATLNNRALLNKALALGQITIIQYFYDESFYFSAYDQYLQAEWEYQQAVARLFKFKL